MVTDASTLSVGDEIIIASSDGKHVMGADKGNNRAAVSTSMNTEKVISYVAGFQEIKLEKGTTNGTFAFNVDNSYLCAASSGSNYLKTLDSFDSNGSWSISISNSIATIKSTGNYTRNTIKYNSNGLLFSCYSRGQQQISVLKKVNSVAKHNVNFITYCDIKIGSKAFAEGAEITLPTEKLIKDGYIFDGWYTDSEFKNKFVEGTKMGTQDITLYANWILDTSTKYTVRFMLNDGTENVYTSTIVRENETIEAPTVPTREGFKFTTWYTNIDLTEEFNFSTSITNDLVLYAGWEVYTIQTYTKVTNNLDDWSGKYLIVYEKENVCFNGSLDLDNIDTANNTKKVTIENNNIIGDYENYQFIFEKKDAGYSIKSYSNIFIGKTAYDNGLDKKKENKFNNSVSMSSNGILTIKASGGTVLKYNSSADQKRFRFYKNGQQDIALYKLEEKQEGQPTVDEATLTSYTSTLSIENSKAIRFIGSVKETEFNNISKIGFNFTLTLDNDKSNPISKEYSIDVNKLYKIINDSNTGIFDNDDAIYENNGFLNFSLILKNIPTNITAKIDFYSYAVINGKTYHSLTKDVVIMNGEIA